MSGISVLTTRGNRPIDSLVVHPCHAIQAFRLLEFKEPPMKRYKTVNEYIECSDHWKEELVQLRKILLSTKLEETVKWGMPCYTLNGKMVVGLGAFQVLRSALVLSRSAFERREKLAGQRSEWQDQSAATMAVFHPKRRSNLRS